MGKCDFASCSEKAVSRGVCSRHFKLLFHRDPSIHDNVIKSYRVRKGWTQTEMARRCGVSYKTIIRWENTKVPKFGDLILLGLDKLDEIERGL